MNKQQTDVILRFMQETIEKVNVCLAGMYTLQKLLIEKKIISEEELIAKLNDDKKKPLRDTGKNILENMVQEFNSDKRSL